MPMEASYRNKMYTEEAARPWLWDARNQRVEVSREAPGREPLVLCKEVERR